MKKTFLLSTLLFNIFFSYGQDDRFKDILKNDSTKTVIEEKKKEESYKVFVTTTEKSVWKSDDPRIIEAVSKANKFIIVQSIKESSLVIDFKVAGGVEASVFDSKSGELILKTRKFNASSTAFNGYQGKKASLNNCVSEGIIPMLNKFYQNPMDNKIVIRTASDFRRVLVVRNKDLVNEMVKGEEFTVYSGGPAKKKSSIMPRSTVLYDLQQKALVKLQKKAAPSRSPVILITESFGVDAEKNEKVGFTVVCYKYKKVQ